MISLIEILSCPNQYWSLRSCYKGMLPYFGQAILGCMGSAQDFEFQRSKNFHFSETSERSCEINHKIVYKNHNIIVINCGTNNLGTYKILFAPQRKWSLNVKIGSKKNC